MGTLGRPLITLAITETELRLMAAPAIIGLRSNPKKGSNTPVANGIPLFIIVTSECHFVGSMAHLLFNLG